MSNKNSTQRGVNPDARFENCPFIDAETAECKADDCEYRAECEEQWRTQIKDIFDSLPGETIKIKE